MYSFKKILVPLDNTEIDQELILAASHTADAAQANDVYFMNVIRDLSVPAAVRKEFPDLMKNALEERRTEIQGKIDKYFTCKNAKVHVEIKNGQPTKSILKFSVAKKVDLIIMGRKNAKPDSGVMINRMARRAACSLLIIPKGYNREVKRIMVPIDFSKFSFEALSTAIEMTEANKPDVDIIAHNVYQVPSGYHYTGKSFKEFAKIMRENLEKDYQKWKKKLPKSELNIEDLYTLDKNDDITEVIYKTATKENVDAIIISTKGLTSTTALFLGSKAEKLIQQNSTIPLVVLRKGEQEGLLEYLRKL